MLSTLVLNKRREFLNKRNKVKDIYDNVDFCFLSIFSLTEFRIGCLHFFFGCLTEDKRHIVMSVIV